MTDGHYTDGLERRGRRSDRHHHTSTPMLVPMALFSAAVIAKAWFARGLTLDVWNPVTTLGLEGGIVIFVFALTALLTGKRRLWAFLAVNAVLSSILLAMTVYIGQYQQLPTLQTLGMAGQLVDVHDSVTALLRPLYLVFFVDIPIAAAIIALTGAGTRHSARAFDRRVGAVAGAAAIWALALVVIAALSGPVADSVALSRVRGVLATTLASPVLFAEDFREAEWREPEVVQAEIDELMGPRSDLRVLRAPQPGSAAGKHIIAIQVESLQTFVINAESEGEEITPNLNKLLGESWYGPNCYTQIGKGNTSDAEFVFNTSLLGLRETAASVAYADKEVPSLPRLLAEQGYESHTFHTNDVTFWDRDSLYPMLGFTKYWEREFFADEDRLGMGSSDEVLFSRSLEVLRDVDESGGRFYANIITLSSHSPFKGVAARSNLPVAPGLEETTLGRYMKGCNYIDAVLGDFFDDLKEAGLWDESIIVIYGDHFGLSFSMLEEAEHAELERILGYPYSMAEHFRVPVFVRVPGQDFGGVVENSLGFVDMMPTIAELTGIDLQSTPHLGRSMFEGGSPIVHLRYYAPEGTFYTDELVFRPGIGYNDATVRRAIGGEVLPLNSVTKDEYRNAYRLLRVNGQYLATLPERQ